MAGSRFLSDANIADEFRYILRKAGHGLSLDAGGFVAGYWEANARCYWSRSAAPVYLSCIAADGHCHPLHLARADSFPAAALRPQWQAIHDAQVPIDGHRRRPAEARVGQVE